MKKLTTTLLVLLLVSLGTVQAARRDNGGNGGGGSNLPPPAVPVDGFEGTWIKPDESTIPNTPEGDMIRYGKRLLTDSYNTMGGGSNFMPPYTGNRLSCSNCHMDDGTAAYAGPWSVVALKYADPGIYSSRTNEFRNRERRINGCMQRSMDGIPLPEEGHEMRSIIAYFEWLATGIQKPTWQEVKGQGFLELADLTRPADPVRGEAVYKEKCEACHQEDGGGVWDEEAQKFLYPAVFGPYSFNDGAGMYRLRTGVRFVYSNMPYGRADAAAAGALGDTSSLLSPEDAWDVMSYVVSQQRPIFENRENDWTTTKGPDGVPDWMKKRPDGAYPIYYPRANYADDYCADPDLSAPPLYSEDKHRYGPWDDMIALQKAIIEEYKARCLPPPETAAAP